MPISPLPIEFSSCEAEQAGPLYKSSTREKYQHALNETASLTDHVFADHLDLFSAFSQQIRRPENTSINAIIEQYKDMIEQHVERRVSFFFQQLVVCYQTKLHFQTEAAQHQGDSPKKVKMATESKETIEFQRNAAHSQTLPLLVAYNAKEWVKYVEKGGTKPKGFTFLKGTDSYRLWNATMNMPKAVNNADICIDGTASTDKLRKKVLSLLNRAAQGDINPESGLEKFIELCREQVSSSISSQKKPAEHQVLTLYLNKLEQIALGFEENREQVLQDLLNINIDDDSATSAYRSAIYQIRYRAIRDSQLEQSKIVQKVNKVRDSVLNSYSRKPAYFDAAFNAILIESGRDKRESQKLSKLCHFSPHDYAVRVKKRKKTFEATKTLLQTEHGAKIREVARRALNDMRTLQTQEAYQRSQITKELRHAKGWTQSELGQRIKAIFSSTAASQSTISRIENRGKLVTPQIAEQLSAVFKIDPGIFMPHFFYE